MRLPLDAGHELALVVPDELLQDPIFGLGLADARIGAHFLRRTFHEFPSLFHHQCTVGDQQCATHILLYDQDGVPIDNLMPVETYEEGGREQSSIRDANGNPVVNAYPRSLLIPDEGGPRPDRRPAVRIPPMAEQTTTTAPPPAATTGPPPG